MKRTSWAAVVILAFIVFGARFGAASAPDAEAIFKNRCIGCHGDKGKGNAALGTPDFSNPKTLASLTDAEIIAIVSNGRPGTIMPAWKETLSPEEIAAIAPYLRSLSR